MPTLLVGGMAVLIQRDLGFGEAALGAAIASAFAAAAVVAPVAGRLAERLGPRRTTWLGLGCGGASLLGIGLVADSWTVLVLFLMVAGIGVTVVQLGVNVLLARATPAHRQGLAFGAKQAAVPLAALLAGLALPLLGLTLGWQVAFVIAAVLVPLVAAQMPDAAGARGDARDSSHGDAPLGSLVLLAVGVAFASAGGNSVPAFIVPSAVDRGLAPADAGLVLAGGSLVGIAVRVAGGWLGDRLGRGSLLLVVALVAVGVVGYAGLAVAEHPILIAASAALAFGGGWGWGGLVLLALARTNRGSPGRAMGIVQVGPMSGAVLGPLLFGTLAEHISFAAAWYVIGVLALTGIAAILLSRRALLRSRASLAEVAGPMT